MILARCSIRRSRRLSLRRARLAEAFVSSRLGRGATTSRLTPTGARYVCDAVARRLQIPSFSAGQLRHTTGTMLQQQTGDSVLTGETLGLASQGSVAVNNTLAQTRRRRARMTSGFHRGVIPGRHVTSCLHPGRQSSSVVRRGLGRLRACRCEAIGSASAISCRVSREWAMAAPSGATSVMPRASRRWAMSANVR
jgi:hypothetical protein